MEKFIKGACKFLLRKMTNLRENWVDVAFPFLFVGMLTSPFVIKGVEVAMNTHTLDERIEEDHKKGLVQQNGEPDKFAVLIGGDMSSWQWEAQRIAYSTLVKAGFNEENIYVLSERSGIKSHRVDDVTSRATVDKLFDHLGKMVDSQDLLYVAFNGHGTQYATSPSDSTLKVSAFCLPYPHHEDHIFMEDLITITGKVKPKDKVMFFSMCNGGDLVNQANRLGWQAMSSSGVRRFSYGSTIPRAFYKAFSDPDSDINNDGELSLGEAYTYAKKNGSKCGEYTNYPMNRFSKKGANINLGPIMSARNNK